MADKNLSLEADGECDEAGNNVNSDEKDTKVKKLKRKKGEPNSASSRKKQKNEAPKEKNSETEESEKNASESDDGKDSENKLPLLDQPTEVSGTRVRKQVQRLNFTGMLLVESPDRKKSESSQGRGEKLGVSPRIQSQLQKVKHSELHLLHRLLFKRPGTAHEIKKNIKEFSGYPFEKDDKEFEHRKHLLEKNTMNDLKFICQMLSLERSGTKEMIIDRIMDFLLCPNPSMKPAGGNVKSKKKAQPKKKGNKLKEKTPSKSSGKSKKSSEVIEDSSSESEDNETSEKDDSASETKPTETGKEEAKAKGKKPAKRVAKKEWKIKLPEIKKKKKVPVVVEDEESEESPKSNDENDKLNKENAELENSEEEVTKNKQEGMATTEQDLTSKDPAVPTDTEIVNTIKNILKDADLERLTMKTLCRKVYEIYPHIDLESTKKEFIRNAAREILGGT